MAIALFDRAGDVLQEDLRSATARIGSGSGPFWIGTIWVSYDIRFN